MQFSILHKNQKRYYVLAAISLVCLIPLSIFAQTAKISIKKNNVSIQTIVQELEKKSDYTFFYNNNQVKLTQKTSVNADNASIEDILDLVFRNSGYTLSLIHI